MLAAGIPIALQSGIGPLFSALLRRIFDISADREPGFIHHIPFLLMLRFLIAFAIVLRVFAHAPEYLASGWPVTMTLLIILFLLAIGVSIVTTRRSLREIIPLQVAIILLDITLISFFYAGTHNPTSDFFLFFYLPALTATEYMGTKGMFGIGLCIAAAFGLVLWLQTPVVVIETPRGTALLLRVLFPRLIFFVSVVQGTCFLLLFEMRQGERAARAERESTTLLTFRTTVDQIFNEEEILKLTVEYAQDQGRQSCAQIFLPGKDGTAIFKGCANIPQADEAEARAKRVIDSEQPSTTPLPNGVGFELCLPLRGAERVLGAAAFIQKERPHEILVRNFLAALAGHSAAALERTRFLAELNEIGRATSRSFSYDQELESLLDALTLDLDLELASLSLINEFDGTIETVRGRNISTDWVTRAVHDLTSNDIQALVVAHPEEGPQRIDGPDPRLDKDMYDAFGHKDLSRIFTPLFDGTKVIGTIETGCNIHHGNELLTKATIKRIADLGRERGSAIIAAHPHTLIKTLCREAMEIVGADSATLHVFDGSPLNFPGDPVKKQILVAWAGLANKEFLKSFPPRRDGLGLRSLRSNKIETANTFQDLGDCRPEISSAGIRSMAAIPLQVGGTATGILYIHYRKTAHIITDAERQLLGIFAKQIEDSIHNYFQVQSIAQLGMGGWTTSGFQSVIQSLAMVERNPGDILSDLARHVLTMLGASNVTLYRYDDDARTFLGELITAGEFLHPEAMTNPLQPGDAPFEAIECGGITYHEQSPTDPFLGEGRKENGFVEREKIKACAVLVLKAPIDNAKLGAVFVNYRTSRPFPIHFRKQVATVATTLAIAIQSDLLRQRMRTSICLNKVASKIRDSVRIEVAKRLVLTGITSAEGLGFSRCAFFQAYNQGNSLRGETGVGQICESEARGVWERLESLRSEWSKDGLDSVDKILDLARECGMQIYKNVRAADPISQRVIGIDIASLDMIGGVLDECVRSKSARVIQADESDPLRKSIGSLSDPQTASAAFACAPVFARSGQLLGMLYADNRFNERKERAIGTEERLGLQAYAELLASTIEDWERWKAEKLKSFTDYLPQLDHAIKNAFRVRVATSCEQLRDAVQELGISDRRVMLAIGEICERLEALRHFLERCTELGHSVDLADRKELDLISVLNKAATEAHRDGLRVHLRWETEDHESQSNPSVVILGFEQELHYAFSEILTNAANAIKGAAVACFGNAERSVVAQSGSETPDVEILARIERRRDNSGSWARVEFADRGPGIDDEQLRKLGGRIDSIFEPFVHLSTHKESKGLGLSLVKRNIEQYHEGEIEVARGSPNGLRITIRVPVRRILVSTEEDSKCTRF